MKIRKLSIRGTAWLSVAVFLFHLCVLVSSLLKLNDRVWSVYKYHGDTLDLLFLGIYCLTFILALAVWLLADAPIEDRVFYGLMSFLFYFIISFVACIVVCHIYGAHVY